MPQYQILYNIYVSEPISFKKMVVYSFNYFLSKPIEICLILLLHNNKFWKSTIATHKI